MELNLFQSKHLLFALIIYIVQTSLIQTQEAKGGFVGVFNSKQLSNQAKGGGTRSSSFRESIESFRRRKQQIVQPIQPVHQTNIVEESVSAFSSSSSAPQKPVALSQQQQEIVVEQQEQQNGLAQSEPASYGGVAGTPGVDFPNYISIPNTRFSCDGLPFNPGMYADESTGCQVYHLCYQGRLESFLCGVGTVFNQAIMNCDFWHSVDCSKSSQYYNLNAEFGKSLGEPAALQQTRPRNSKSSSQVVRQRSSIAQPARPPVVSSAATKQQSSLASQISNRPALINTIQSSSEFSSSRLTSDFRQNDQPQPGLFSGKTSIRREKQTSSGLLSPARQLQFNQGQLDGSSGQFTLESSTRFKVMPGVGMGNLKGGQSSISVGSTLVVADNGAMRPAEQETLEKPRLSGDKAQQSEQTPATTKTSNDDNGGWKPYFKSKTNSKAATTKFPPAAAVASSMKTPAPATSTSSTTEGPQPVKPAPVSRPDQEPVFSWNHDKDQSQEVPKQPAITSTTEPPSGIGSLEPDVGSAVSVTGAPSKVAATTTMLLPATILSSEAGQSETPGKSEPPPSTARPVSNSEAPTSTNTAAAASTTQATPSEETSTSAAAEIGHSESSSGPKKSPMATTTTAPPPTTTTLKGSSGSMVEYAGGEPGEGEGEGETEKASEAEEKKKAALKRRKAT